MVPQFENYFRCDLFLFVLIGFPPREVGFSNSSANILNLFYPFKIIFVFHNGVLGWKCANQVIRVNCSCSNRFYGSWHIHP